MRKYLITIIQLIVITAGMFAIGFCAGMIVADMTSLECLGHCEE